MKHGFYLTLGRDIFFVTERKRKDKGTLNLILDKMGYQPTEDRRRDLDWWLSKATAEVRYTETTKTPYWCIQYGTSTVQMPYADLEIVNL